MQSYLHDILKDHVTPVGIMKDNVMELMAGVGRNYNTLKYFFSNIEMIEQSPEMYKKIPTEVTIHKKLIQDFEWPIKEYDCVVGVWCFCYLNESDM